MQRTLLLSIILLFTLNSTAQQLRYYHKLYDSVQTIVDQVYGSNYVFDVTKGQFGATMENQTLDIYLPPSEDTTTNRPLLIWAHGGSFLNGTKADKDIVYFCNEYAKRGFVCVSINYRLGYEPPLDSVKATRTVFRALQDGRAATRYMRSRAQEFNIDKNRVYFGGTSAGAFIALNVAYLNLPEEVPVYLDTTAHDEINSDPQIGIDGIEGLTNAIVESSEIMGIINYCGATKTTAWMDDTYSRSIPVISMHGTRDSTVPYATRIIYLNDLTPIPPQAPIPIVEVQGSYDIDRHADKAGYLSKFYTWYLADHVPYINYDDNGPGAAYMDTVMRFTVKHIYEDFLKLGMVDGLDENEPPCDFNNGVESPCAPLTISELMVASAELYPNPSNTGFQIHNAPGIDELIISDVNGRIVKVISGKNGLFVSTIDLYNGVYTVEIKTSTTTLTKRLVVLH